jgi:hypothetical protein
MQMLAAGLASLLAGSVLGCAEDWSITETLRPRVEPLGSLPAAPAVRTARAPRPTGPSGGRRRVWLVGIDGFSPIDFGLRRKTQPYKTLKQLAHEGRSTLDARVPGGPADCGEGAVFESAPGWANILTGRDCREHRVLRNGDTSFLRKHSAELPTLLATAHRELGLVTAAVGGDPLVSRPEATQVAGLEPSGLLAIEGFVPGGGAWTNLDAWVYTQSDDALAEETTIAAIVELDADLVFTHFDEVDHIGHMHGYGSPGWAKRLDRTDERIGRVLAAIRGQPGFAAQDASRRLAFEQEDWLIVVVSDHGGHDTPGCQGGRCCVPGFGRCGTHDRMSGVDDRVPFILWTTGGRATPLAPLQDPVSQLDVRPTVLAWLGSTEEASPGRNKEASPGRNKEASPGRNEAASPGRIQGASSPTGS